MPESKQIIKVDNISYTYPLNEDPDESRPQKSAQPAVKHASLDVHEGQFICILGSNGSGKSTLARHLNALLFPDEGTVWINGMNTADPEKLWDIRSQTGMVFQNPDNQIIASRVDEDVAFGPENIGIESNEIVKRVSNALKEVGLEGFDHKNPGNLSGGQKQRVAIAGILAMRPRCIVLDESTSMLDPTGRDEIMDTVVRLNKEEGITLIVITHFMEEAAEADKVFIMDKGEILLEGTPKQVFAHKKEIEQAGLMQPLISILADKLRENGLDIPEVVLTADELRKYI